MLPLELHPGTLIEVWRAEGRAKEEQAPVESRL